MMYHYWYGYGGFGAVLALVGMVLFWGGLITIAVVLIRRFGTGSRSGPLRILEERFARSEIDAEEYARRRDLLSRQ